MSEQSLPHGVAKITHSPANLTSFFPQSPMANGNIGRLEGRGNSFAAKLPQGSKLAQRMREGVFNFFEGFACPAHANQGDESAHDVVGPFADSVDTGITHHAFVRLVAEIGLATVDLNRVIYHFPKLFAGEYLKHGGFSHEILCAAVNERSAMVSG